MRFTRALVVAFTLPLLAATTSASLLEDVSGGAVSYQFDGSSHHDAPDACGAASRQWELPLGGSTDGLLVPADDLADSFVLDVPATGVGRRLSVTVEEMQGTPDLAVSAFAPGCLSVFDPTNLPTPAPSPPAPREGEEQVSAERTSQPFVCFADAWVFVVDGLDSPAPATIHVAWTDGTEGPVALSSENRHHSVYMTDRNLATTLKGAWINLPAGWEGDFFLAAGPCDAADGGAVYGEPPVSMGSLLTFTPVRAGLHVVRVTMADDPQVASGSAPCAACLSPMPVPEPGHTVEDVLEDPTDLPSLVVPATCHFCAPQVRQLIETVSYLLRSDLA